MKTALSVEDEHRQVRENTGFFLLDGWSLISATGKDVFSYLQTQTTNDIHTLAVGQGQNSAIVDRKARLISVFSVHRLGECSVVLLVESCLKDILLQHLGTYLFREDVQLEPMDHVMAAIQGPRSVRILQELGGNGIRLPEKPNDILSGTLDGQKVTIINKTLTGEEGFILCFDSGWKEHLIGRLNDFEDPHKPVFVSPETREILRIEAGIPRYGKDFDEKNILPETGLEHTSVSYNKGCYIGQEVIARIKTYGAPNFALMGLALEGESLPPYGADIRLEGKKIGTVKSSIFSLSLGKNVAFAYVQKDHRSPEVNLELSIGDRTYQARTVLLPFFQALTRKDHSRHLHDQALRIYKEEEGLDRPIRLLREAIDLDPKNAAAYEALGVFLSKQDKLDEAIALMKRLAEIDPSGIMAHTNLSIYYMKQGRIEDAEKEKGEATALQFEQVLAEKMKQKKSQEQEEEIRKEQERKMEMFQKVLEIDPADQIANFGLGSIYLELERFEEALGPLKTVIEKNKDYSAAYLLLGKTLEKLARVAAAAEVYRNGIATASRKGDLMPLKDMQNRLNQLLHSES